MVEVKTKSGVVLGAQEGRLYCFRGIPYAQAKRFQPPSPVEWGGVLDATRFGKNQSRHMASHGHGSVRRNAANLTSSA